ncbi:hypothetical protein [Weissella bombi]|uniref:Enterocin A Immunity n=1 Tax=Weissella bombi TaxID=1505725 RepID=A0A1C3Z1S5_9LACO|nr:hypothetical protein [Weissella bombi]SCB76285.1 hypothetical protein GA0061074_101259 [Weissella bombi]
MFKNDEKQRLLNFLAKHPMMNEQEKSIITSTVNQMTNQNQDIEILSLIKTLRQLSSKHGLSDDGRTLLTKLHRRQWIWGVIGVLPFF